MVQETGASFHTLYTGEYLFQKLFSKSSFQYRHLLKTWPSSSVITQENDTGHLTHVDVYWGMLSQWNLPLNRLFWKM